MRIRTANNRRKRAERRARTDAFYMAFLRANPDVVADIVNTFGSGYHVELPRKVTCNVCGELKSFFMVNPTGVCSDCD